MVFITVPVLHSADTYGSLQSMKLAATEKRTLNFLQFCFISSREKPESSDISFQIVWKNSNTYFSLIMRYYPFVEKKAGTSLVVQWLGLHVSNTGVMGSVPD